MKYGHHSPFLLQIERSSNTPLFRQVYLQLRSSILSQNVPPGTKLPSTRELAEDLDISRAVVVLAYEQLLAEGCVNGRIGSGTYVADLANLGGSRPSKMQRRATKPPRLVPRGSVDVTEQSNDRPLTLDAPFWTQERSSNGASSVSEACVR